MTLLPRLLASFAALCLAVFLAPVQGDAFQVVDDLPPADFEVETRGPIHEAFAQLNDGVIEPGMVVPKQPPPMIPEQPPEQRPDAANLEWIPGYWAWDAERNDFVWVSGTFRNPPIGRRWIPGHWVNADGGWRWVAGFWAPENQQELQYTPEPPAPLENGPLIPAPNADSTYVPGYWTYNNPDQRFAWRPGYWAPFRQGRIWIGPQYGWTPGGYVFTSGYWDYPLDDRGLLFAPAYFPTPLWGNPGWSYQPSFVVSIGFFFNSGFYRPGGNHFYFGNYYGNHHAGLGYRPWWGGPGNSVNNYYRWQNRGNRQWAAQHQQNFDDRRAGRAPVPPANFAQQRAQQNGKNGGLAAVTPLRTFTPANGSLVANRPDANQKAHLDQYRDLAKLRDNAENRAKNGGPKNGGNPGAAQPTTLKLPPAQPRGGPGGFGDDPFRAGTRSPQSPTGNAPKNGGNPFAGKLPSNPSENPGAGPAKGPASVAGPGIPNPYQADQGKGPNSGPQVGGSPNPVPPLNPGA
ncbi:MAG: hypothetical protein WCL32_03870, partial [Planctomycetota bacterium]